MFISRSLCSIVYKSILHPPSSHLQLHFLKSPSTLTCFATLKTMAVNAPVKFDYGSFLVELVPALGDNYMYVVIDKASNEAAVVDPVDPKAILKVVDSHNADLKYVWTTHHHYDHAGGNLELKELKPHVKVLGGGDNIPAVNQILKHDDEFTLGKDTHIHAIHTPCHTTTSICYNVYNKDKTADIVFTGDTLFIAGAGKFFEGNGADMHNNLNVKLSKLPDKTGVFCGHEYTVSNLQFAQHMEPNNTHIAEKLAWAKAKRAKMEPTVPSTIGEEKATNPFMRIMKPEYSSLADSCKGDMHKVMDLVREKKNNFRAS